MTDLFLGPDLQPVFRSTKDYKTIEGQEEFHQWLRLEAQERLSGILSRYKTNSVPQKIRKELSELAYSSNFVDSIESIEVRNLQKDAETDGTGFKATIRYNQTEDFDLLLEGL